MSKKCILEIKDEVNIKWHDLDAMTRRKLVQELEYFLPHARHTPAFKLGRWNGKVSYCDIGGRSYINLLDRMLPIVQNSGYEVSISDNRPSYEYDFTKIDKDSYSHIKWPEGHPMAGQPVELREHQIEMVNNYIENYQSINVCPTAGGKTIVCAILSDKVEKYGKSIIIVPSTSLVTQTEEDYINFGLDVGVVYGARKEFDKKHTICTWQSLESLAKASKKGTAPVDIEEFLEGVSCVIVDEVHRTTGKVLRELLGGPFRHVPLRWGMTGTMPENDYDNVAVECCVGNVTGKITASDLQDKGYLAKLDIDVWQLQDPIDNFGSFQTEQKWLTTNKDRLQFISDEISQMVLDEGNTLVLVDRIETGELLNEMIPNSIFLSGRDGNDERKKEYKSFQDSDNKILIGSYGITSTGISINRIFNLVLFEPGKSFVRVIQSIGRGLRVAEDKEHVNVVDICSKAKYSRRHSTKRKKFYKDQGYPYKITKKKY